MLTIPFIRENRDTVISRLKIKNFTNSSVIDEIISIDNERRALQAKCDSKQNEVNSYSKEIGTLIRSGDNEGVKVMKARMTDLKDELKILNQNHTELAAKLDTLLIQIPNLPHESVPPGKGDKENVVIRGGGETPELDNSALPHWDLIKKYDIIDFELGTKLTGAGFPVYKEKGAKLERALINFFLDENIRAGYREFLPPLMVNEDSAYATGQLPDKEGQMYTVPSDTFYLIPTAEVPVTNLFRDQILNEDELPIRCTAYTPCFRREAGSWGKDVRGLNRLHQFDKVEIVQIQFPEKSYAALEEMANHIETLVKKLGLYYRIVKLCGGALL